MLFAIRRSPRNTEETATTSGSSYAYIFTFAERRREEDVAPFQVAFGDCVSSPIRGSPAAAAGVGHDRFLRNCHEHRLIVK